MLTRIHSTAIIEQDVHIGQRSAIWDHVHIRCRTKLGNECIVGEKTHIAYDVRIGNRVKLNAFVYVCTGVTIEDGVMISAGTVFTNDRTPRATTPDLMQLRTSAPDEHTRPTLVREGATIGARCVIGSDLAIGRFAMIGMGSVVTKSIPDFHLAIGHPAKSVGCVCRCGDVLMRFDGTVPAQPVERRCSSCGLSYLIVQQRVRELSQPDGVRDLRPLSVATAAFGPSFPHDAA